jgi:uncharacterized protein YbgA (DUF1722 family)
MHLGGSVDATRLVVTAAARDLTRRMRRFADGRARELGRLGIRGFIAKSRSPSCGLGSVPLRGARGRVTNGLFTAALRRRLPLLPITEDLALHETGAPRDFVERLLAYDRWCRFRAARPGGRMLAGFHEKNRLTLLAHSWARTRHLDQLVLESGPRLSSARLDAYGKGFMAIMELGGSRAKHVAVLRHLSGRLRGAIDPRGRAALAALIDGYRTGSEPLNAPITLLRRQLRRCGFIGLLDATYLDPTLSAWTGREIT